MNDLLRGNISNLLTAYRSGETTPESVCQSLLTEVRRFDDRMNAFLRLDEELVLQQARDALEHLDKPLAGVPIAIKDTISTKGMETTCGSRILAGYIPPYDATVIERLKNAGAIVFGKTNCDEFAMGSSTENSGWGPTRNPWNPDFTPGGSSGGSAAAVASGFCFAALGSDTGGSIRQPAALTGIVGLKPTYGRVSRYGLVAFGSSLDCIGPLTRSAEDAALILQVISGYDTKDSTSSTVDTDDYSSTLRNTGKLRVGVPAEYFAEGIDPEVSQSVRSALAWMEQEGNVEVQTISLPHTEYAIPVYYLIATAEASSNLSRFDGVRYGYRVRTASSLLDMYNQSRAAGFGPEVKRRIMLGTFALSAGYYDAYYATASRVRNLIAQDFENAWEKVDVICTPTSPTPAFRLGEKMENPLTMYLSDIYTVTANLAELPAVSIPCGFHSNGLPIGLQIIGKPMEEGQILCLASRYLKRNPVQMPELT